MKRLPYIVSMLAIVPLLIASCENGPEGQDGPVKPAKYTVSGRVEKGPFISGSTLNLQPLDASYRPVGTNFHSEIVDNAGNFSLGELTLDTPYAVLTANGYFYNEIENQLSNGTLTLNAIVDLRNKTSVNINILTHLKYYRVQKLLSIGQSFSQADRQAQEELMRAFGLEKYNTSDFSQFSIVSGTDQAAALLSISALVLIGRKEAALTEYLATLSKEFGDNGFFSVTTKEVMDADRYKLMDKMEAIASNVESKYSSLDQAVTVKDLASYYDWDGDGVAGNEIASGDDAVQLSDTALDFPSDGGTKRVQITSTIPLSLTQHTNGPIATSPISTEYYDNQLFSTGPIKYGARIEGDELVVTVQPASYRIVSGTTVNFYDYRNKVVASVRLTQQGSSQCELWGNAAGTYFASVASRLAKACSEYLKCDLSYSRVFDAYSMAAPLTPNNSGVSSLFTALYQGINVLNSIISYLESRDASMLTDLEQPILALKTMRALSYYKLMSFWSSVPYVTSTDPDIQYNKTDQSVIISTLKEELDAAIAKLPDKRNILEPFSASSFLGFSRDVPRFIMAKIYLMIGDYQKAKTYLEPVVTGGYYSMEAHQFENGVVLYDDCADEELVWGLQYVLSRSDYPCTPVLTYTDVLLDMCEICLKLEEYAKAQEYMNTLRSAYSQSQESWANPNYFLNEIYGWRKRTVNCRGEYFDFLRRTGLAKSELGLQDYQLLFPFPEREVAIYPDIQNPGY